MMRESTDLAKAFPTILAIRDFDSEIFMAGMSSVVKPCKRIISVTVSFSAVWRFTKARAEHRLAVRQGE